MGAYCGTCPDCGKAYWWYSFTLKTIAKGARCETCWEKLFEKIKKKEEQDKS